MYNKKSVIFCIVIVILNSGAIAYADLDLMLKKFEILHLKIIRAPVFKGLYVEYIGSTRFSSEDRIGDFLHTSGHGQWVIRKSSLSGIDPSSEIGRITVAKKSSKGSFPVEIDGHSFYLTFTKTKRVNKDGAIEGLNVPPEKVFESISRTNIPE
jgi:hypothetical protein